MAVVLGTAITLATLLSMAASAGAVAGDIAKIVEGLKAQGHPADQPIPADAQLAVQKALDRLPQPLPADFGTLAASDQTQVQSALDAVRAVFVIDVTVDGYRADALSALYKLAEYLDDQR